MAGDTIMAGGITTVGDTTAGTLPVITAGMAITAGGASCRNDTYVTEVTKGHEPRRSGAFSPDIPQIEDERRLARFRAEDRAVRSCTGSGVLIGGCRGRERRSSP